MWASDGLGDWHPAPFEKGFIVALPSSGSPPCLSRIVWQIQRPFLTSLGLQPRRALIGCGRSKFVVSMVCCQDVHKCRPGLLTGEVLPPSPILRVCVHILGCGITRNVACCLLTRCLQATVCRRRHSQRPNGHPRLVLAAAGLPDPTAPMRRQARATGGLRLGCGGVRLGYTERFQSASTIVPVSRRAVPRHRAPYGWEASRPIAAIDRVLYSAAASAVRLGQTKLCHPSRRVSPRHGGFEVALVGCF